MRKKVFIVFTAAVMAMVCLFTARGITARAYTNTSAYNSRLQISPSVVARIEGKAAFDAAVSADNKPASVILGIDANGLSAESGESVGKTDEVFKVLSDAGILLIVRLESALNAQTLYETVSANDLSDFAVMSDSESVIKRAKELMPFSRAIFDFSAENAFSDPYEYIRICRTAGGSTVVLSQEAADRETVYYLQSMMTTVWVIAASETQFGFASAVSTGAYGIIAKDHKTLYSVYDKYPVYSLPRGYYVIGHRGLPFTENENSLESCIAAYEAGATHLEIDVQTTADEKLVIMHDDVIDTTTDGSGAVANMTLEEIRRHKIIKSKEWEGSGNKLTVPTLAEIFDYFKDKDIVIIVEIKDSKALTCKLVKEEIERANMQRKTVSISFYDTDGSQLERMHDLMPTLPIASLLQPTEDNFDEFQKRAARLNMVFNPSYQTSHGTFFNSNLKDRGYMAWSWTHRDPSAVQIGITGMTNDYADIFGKYAKRMTAPKGLSVEHGESITDKTFSVEQLNFDGSVENVSAKVFMSEEAEGGYNAILVYEFKDDEYYCKYNLFTQPVFIAEKEAPASEEPEQPKKGCGNSAAAGSVAAGACLIAAAGGMATLKRKKRHNKPLK